MATEARSRGCYLLTCTRYLIIFHQLEIFMSTVKPLFLGCSQSRSKQNLLKICSYQIVTMRQNFDHEDQSTRYMRVSPPSKMHSFKQVNIFHICFNGTCIKNICCDKHFMLDHLTVYNIYIQFYRISHSSGFFISGEDAWGSDLQTLSKCVRRLCSRPLSLMTQSCPQSVAEM